MPPFCPDIAIVLPFGDHATLLTAPMSPSVYLRSIFVDAVLRIAIWLSPFA